MSSSISPEIVLKCGFKRISFPENHFTEHMTKNGQQIVYKITELKEQFPMLSAVSQASMKESKPPYNISIKLNALRMAIECKCTCKAGIVGKCKHAAAVMYKVNNENVVSCTSEAKSWGKPASSTLSKNKTIVGDLVEEKIPKRVIEERDNTHLIEKHIIDLDSPFMQMYNAKKKKQSQ